MLRDDWRNRRALPALIAATLAVLWVSAFAATAARADYQGPDENASQAYGPLKGSSTYLATLNQSGGSPDDQDWYYYYVPTAGDHLHWTVSNTNAATACLPYQCNVYATLEDSNSQQLGGNNSSAGTSGVGPGQTQTIDWTFQTPGKYYVAFVGDGPRISYQFSVTPASGLSTTPPGAPKPSLHLSWHQRGRDVDISLRSPSSGARLDARLYTGAGRTLKGAGELRRNQVPKGTDHYAIGLNSRAWSALKTRHRLTLTLRVTLTASAGVILRASQKVVMTHRR
jgi:hypothetical protein